MILTEGEAACALPSCFFPRLRGGRAAFKAPSHRTACVIGRRLCMRSIEGVDAGRVACSRHGVGAYASPFWRIVKLSPLTREGFGMARQRSTMSDAFKVELAKELGFYDTVQREGWGGIKARDAGNMVKRAIEIAEQALAEKSGQR
ncbi:Small, acid-soluble spore protein, alpha/beta type [Alicyclobacillus vulcanalis]|nr:Small, acid-soluble spore protein, alpha/beta type [Alicyclobacillus vulcanalis]